MNALGASPNPVESQDKPEFSNTVRLLSKLAREGFYGKLTISFEAGRVVTLRKEEVLKPVTLSR